VASHAAALGADSALISRIGCDADGEMLENWVRQRGVRGFLQRDPQHPTGSVEIRPGPCYDIAAPAAWDFIESPGGIPSGVGAVVFGTLAQRHPVSRRTIRGLIDSARGARVPVLCDLNLRPPFYDEETVLWSLRNCDVLKINREELRLVSDLLGARGNDEELFRGLLREFSITKGALTAGGEGAVLLEDGNLFRQPAQEVACIVDAVGAGDAFAAVLATGLARGLSLRSVAAPASALAAFVVSQQGATPAIPRVLAARINAMLGV
jgi:fructokinase